MKLYLAALSLLFLNSCTKSPTLPVKDEAQKNKLRAANASQLKAWTPPWAQMGVLISDPRLPFQIVEELKETYQHIPAVTKAAQGLTFRHSDGTRITTAKWGGLDFSRGFAAFIGGQGAFRIIFGVTDLARSLDSSAQVLKTNFGIEVSATKTSLNLSKFTLACIETDGLAICDTAGRPSQPEHALEQLTQSQTKDDIAWGFAVVSGRLAQNIKHFVFALRSTEQIIGGHLTAHLQPQARMMSSMFLGDKPQKSALKNVVTGGGFLHANIPDATLQQLRNRVANEPKSPMGQILNGLNGDYTITTDGSLLNLVMAVGIKSKAAANSLMAGLMDILARAGCARDTCSKIGPSKTVDGAQVLSLSFKPPKAEKISVDLHHAYVNDELVFALSPADLRRRLDSAWTSHKPIDLLPGTLIQANVGNPFMLMNSVWMREIMNLGAAYDLTTLLGSKMVDFGESKMTVRFVDSTLKAHLQLARLPKDGAGAKLYADSVAASLLGDNLKANLGWHKLAAEYPNSPYGQAGKNRANSLGPMGPAIIGLLAAVAVPAFMKYIRRSKTSEATMNVRKLFDGAVAYAHNRVDKDSPPFPESTPLTPGNPTQFMCKDGESQKYRPTADTFSHASWQALNFAVTDPFFYAYQFESKNQGGKSMFTVRAVGDLNCDGTLSTFERIGYLDEDGNISGGAGLFTKDELE
mgnify:CR=1 FL=1